MKPSITVDERGILLHLTDAAGNGYAIPLEPATVFGLVDAATRAAAALKTPGGRSVLVRALGGLFAELTKQPQKEESENGTPDADGDGKANS